MKLSIILPAKNEASSLESLLPEIRKHFSNAEIIVANDGSTDATSEIAKEHGAKVIDHLYSKGNGAAIKSGARAAIGDILVFMDADGQHKPEDIQSLLDKIDQGYDLVVGARSAQGDQASIARWGANWIYSKLASWMVGHHIDDLTSGFRAARASVFRNFLHLLPNGFSYPTTSTMAFFRAGFNVTFVPISTNMRIGGNKSHIKMARDGAKFFLIIFRITTLYSPLKIFFPASVVLSASGIWYYVYTYAISGRFTNFGAVLILSAVVVFLIGLISEQITMLIFRSTKDD